MKKKDNISKTHLTTGIILLCLSILAAGSGTFGNGIASIQGGADKDLQILGTSEILFSIITFVSSIICLINSGHKSKEMSLIVMMGCLLSSTSLIYYYSRISEIKSYYKTVVSPIFLIICIIAALSCLVVLMISYKNNRKKYIK